MGINNLRIFWKKRIKIRMNTKNPVLEFTPSIPINLGSKISFSLCFLILEDFFLQNLIILLIHLKSI